MRRDGIIILLMSLFALLFWVVVELSKRVTDIVK